MCCALSLCLVQLFAAPWTLACQAPRPMEFSRQEFWAAMSCSRGIKPTSLVSSPSTGGFFTTSTTWEAQVPSKADQKTHQKENYHTPPSPHTPACLTLNIPHHSRAFVTTNQRTLTHHYDPKSNI